jgi:glutamate/tyrosine decarboxylase-like PLP-dependent enzyme
VYAAVRARGRAGISDMIERCCAHARRFAEGLAELGAEVLNDVELNQVLFRLATDEETNAVLKAVQDDGASWMGGTIWDGRPAIRLSISNWQTTEDDVERTLAVYAGQLAAR